MTNDETPLADEPFDYQVTKDNRVLFYYHDQHVKTIAGSDARKFIAQAEGLDEPALQVLMARATGNFKRGNEREGKDKGK